MIDRDQFNDMKAFKGHNSSLYGEREKFAYQDLSQIMWNVYEMVLTQGEIIYDYKKMDRPEKVVLISHMVLSFLLVFIGFNTFAALAVSNYQHAYKRCVK